MKKHLDGSSLEESLDAFVREALSQGMTLGIEVCRFSGFAADIRLTDTACYLRLEATRMRDGQGQPHEMMARLGAIGGRWHIPREPAEMLVIVASGTEGVPGAGFALNVGLAPPSKLAQGKAYDVFDDETAFLSRAMYHVFKSALNTVFGTDPDGNFQISLSKGTKIVATPGAIELSVTDGEDPPTVKSILRLDRDGISLASGGKIAAKWDGTNGAFTAIGDAGCYLAHPGGVLGPAGTLTLATGGGVTAPSTTWKIAG